MFQHVHVFALQCLHSSDPLVDYGPVCWVKTKSLPVSTVGDDDRMWRRTFERENSGVQNII